MSGNVSSTRIRRTLSTVCVAAALLVPTGLAATAAADPLPQADDIHGMYEPSPQWCPGPVGRQSPRYPAWQPPYVGGWQPPYYGGWQQPVYGGQQYGELPLIILATLS